jgi:OPA family glycerol-3-phosphate transporter-like MFS transporter
MTPSDPERMRRWQLRIFAVTWLAYAGFYLTRKSFSIAKVELQKPDVLGLSTGSLAVIDGGYLIAYSLGQFCWGVLGDRFGTRAVVLTGMAASIAVAVAMGSVTHISAFTALFMLQGVCQSSGWAPLTKNIGEFFPRSVRGRVMGLWCSNFAIGGMAAGVIAGLAAQGGGWRLAFFVPAAILAVVWLVFFLGQVNRPEDVGLPSAAADVGEPEDVIIAGEAPAGEPEGSWRVVAEVMASPMVLLLAAVYLLVKPLRYLLMFWAPVYLHERLGTSVAESGILGSLFDLAGPIGIFAGGWASDRLFHARRVPVMVITLAAAAGALALLPLMPASRLAVGSMLFVIGLLVYIPDSLVSGAAAIDFGTRKGASTAAGIINGSGSLGGVLGGTLPGVLSWWSGSESTPWNTLFEVMAGGLLVAAVLLAPQWSRVPATGQSNKKQKQKGASHQI